MYAHRKARMAVRVIEKMNHKPVISKNSTGHRLLGLP
jgi:hypothetical protein